ncbi:MAG: coenzyme F420-0:L-glutamate ligase [Betaproteobacteria bacterium]|nr:coenzyme F420-0:L-glutamate ligase [Betaproteobacteria bacterium]
MQPASLQLLALPDFPLVQPGDDLVALIAAAVERSGMAPADGDVFVVAQKIVSKAENRIVDLASVVPSAHAIAVAAAVRKDPRLVEVILSESRRIVRQQPDVLIVEHRLGLVMANAGVDQSNVGPADGGERALLLPEDPDRSAEALRAGLQTRVGLRIGVIINDSFGRAWRRGTVGVALGAAGLPAVIDKRGEPDLFGRTLRATVIGYADEIAAAASLLMGQADEGRPVVIVRGLRWSAEELPGAALIRPEAEDMFR